MPSTPTPRTIPARTLPRHGGFPHPGSLGFQFQQGWFGWRPYAFYPGSYGVVGPRYVKHEIGDVFFVDTKVGSYAVYRVGNGRFAAVLFPIRSSITMFPNSDSVEGAKQNVLSELNAYYGDGVYMTTIWVMAPQAVAPSIAGSIRPTSWPHSYRWSK